eukprot:1175846-Prorocentrum_minimum.AAC.2
MAAWSPRRLSPDDGLEAHEAGGHVSLSPAEGGEDTAGLAVNFGHKPAATGRHVRPALVAVRLVPVGGWQVHAVHPNLCQAKEGKAQHARSWNVLRLRMSVNTSKMSSN